MTQVQFSFDVFITQTVMELLRWVRTCINAYVMAIAPTRHVMCFAPTYRVCDIMLLCVIPAAAPFILLILPVAWFRSGATCRGHGICMACVAPTRRVMLCHGVFRHGHAVMLLCTYPVTAPFIILVLPVAWIRRMATCRVHETSTT